MFKVEFNEKYNYVFGLNNINIFMFGGKIEVVMGLFGFGKLILIWYINWLIDLIDGEVFYGIEDVCKML